MVSKPGGKAGFKPASVSQPKANQKPSSSEGTDSAAGHTFGTHTGGVGGTRKK